MTVEGPSSFQLAILRGLGRMKVYQGTVPAGEVALRRKKAKAQRKARRVNR